MKKWKNRSKKDVYKRQADGSYYFINSSLKAVKNTYYAFSATHANGLLPAGRYFFGEDGKLVQN